jgi:CheY-like chemotaxis protein
MTALHASESVLLAEDDDNDVVLIRRALERAGTLRRLTVVEDGEQVIPYLLGLDKYADRRWFPFPNVVILDRRMRGLSGLDVLFWLRTEPRFKALPVLVLSNGFSPNELLIVERLNAAHVLKTTRLAELPQALESGIESAKLAARKDTPMGGPIRLDSPGSPA